MDKISVQGVGYMFEQFKNVTSTQEWNYKPGCYVFGLYLFVFVLAKIVRLLPSFMDDLISFVRKIGELSNTIVKTIPQFLSSVRALLGLFWSLVYAVVWFVITPAYHFVRQICIFLYQVYLKLENFVRYLRNGFKWPEEENKSVPALTQGYIPPSPRSGRNHYGFGKLKV